MSGKYKIVRGCVYDPDTGIKHRPEEIITLSDRGAEFLGDRVHRVFSPETFLSQNVGPISEAIHNGERDEYLDELEKLEQEGKERKTVLDAIDSRQKDV